MGAIYRDCCGRIERSGYAVFGEPLRLPRWRKAAIALRVWLSTRSRGAGSSPADAYRGLRHMATHDVIVIGAGVAGLSAAVALAERGARVLVVEARPTLGGRAMSHRDPATGEIVDNGQHILMGCYRESFAFLERIGTAPPGPPAARASKCPWSIAAACGRRCRARRCRRPGTCSAASSSGSALGWRDRLSVFSIGAAIRTAQRHLAGKTTDLAASPGRDRRELAHPQRPDGAYPRDVVGTPGAGGDEPAGRAKPAQRRSCGSWRQAFGSDATDAALALPAVPLTELYVEPAREFIESARRPRARQRARPRHARKRASLRSDRCGRESTCALTRSWPPCRGTPCRVSSIGCRLRWPRLPTTPAG